MSLPEHRRAINGRTYSQPWSAASMDPVEGFYSPWVWFLECVVRPVVCVGACVVIGWLLYRWI